MYRLALRLVAIIQIILGLAYLLAPGSFLAAMGHSQLPPDLAYPLGMLAARFLAYGTGLWMVSNEPEKHRLWIRLMALIQVIDFGVGLAYTLGEVVHWSHSAFPMFNAAWIALLCLYTPRPSASAPQAATA